MKILIFSWRGPSHPRAGGAEVVTHEYAKGWVRSGHRVSLLTSKIDNLPSEEVLDGVKIMRKGSEVLGVHLTACFWYLFFNKERFDLIIDQFHGIPFFTPLFVKTRKLAFIHEVAKEVWSLNPWPKPFNFIPMLLGQYFERFIFKCFYKNIPFMTVSKSTKQDLVLWGIPESNIHVIHNGLDSVENKRKYSKEIIKTIIFLGTLSKDKGIEDALKMFSILNHQPESWRFWIVGKGELHYVKYLKNLANKLGILRNTKFWGFVSQQKKFELLGRAHLLISPSVREGWGLVVIEAASVGTPTISYNVPGLRDSIINNRTGILCENNSYKCLAAKALEIMDDSNRYGSLNREAIKWSRNFSWDKSISQSLDLLKSISKIPNE